MNKLFRILGLLCLLCHKSFAQEPILNAPPSAFRFIDGTTYFVKPVGFGKSNVYLIEYKSGKRFLLERGQSTTSYTNQVSGFELKKNDNNYSLLRTEGLQEEKVDRMALKEETTTFMSGKTRLFGKLVLPEGRGKFPVVIIAHGSDNISAVNTYVDPYIFASQGIACFVYDKRGTGKSEGQAILNFQALSDDMVAAINHLKILPSIDTGKIGISGYSQGGWIAPLAASKCPTVKFAVINYGMAMSVADEDMYEAPLKLADMGVDEKSIKEFMNLNKTIHQVVKDDFKAGWIDKLKTAYEKYSGRSWIDSLKKTQTWAGSIMNMGWDQVEKVAPTLMRAADPFYDPVATLKKINIPMLWLFGDADIEAPPQKTIKAINILHRQHRKPFELKIYKNADHGLLLFIKNGNKRVYTDYAPGYFTDVIKWVKMQ